MRKETAAELPVAPSNRNQYLRSPDLGSPPAQIRQDLEQRMLERLELLYGPDTTPNVYRELMRLIRVHRAHETPGLDTEDRALEPQRRFDETDVVLITYGDLLVSDNRSPLQTLADFTEVFFRGIVTTLHILPFFPHSSDRGFSVISYTDVDPRLGTWDEIDQLSRSFKLIFDGVVNHCSAQSEWFRRFLQGDPDYRDFFIVFSSRCAVDDDHLALILRPRTSDLLTEVDTLDGPRYVWTTFSADQVDLNFKNPKVLLKIVEILLFYVRHGADIVRLDAITYLWYELGTTCAHLEQTHVVVKLLRDVLDAAAPRVALLTETNVPHADNISYFGDGSDEAQMIYNFALPPLVLHTFLTGCSETLTEWIRDLDFPSETTSFLNFLDSHDGIGLMGVQGILSENEILSMCRQVEKRGGLVSYRDNGDKSQSPYELNTTWFSALNPEGCTDTLGRQVDRFIASRAIALMLRGVPGIYLPSFFGLRNDVESALRDGCRRSINRSAIDERALFAAFADPDSAEARIARRFVDLLEARVAEPAFHPNGAQQVLDLGSRVLAVRRDPLSGGRPVLAVINVTDRPITLRIPLAEAGLEPGEAIDLVAGSTYAVEGPTWLVELEPYQVAWFRKYKD